ncbi:transcription factor kua1 [Quercus suber]|uniref:Transcription factor kua1 n=1 Tax=Quercus suber TaxID=58331 RepID=A0AAW0IRP7_QUESU
MSEELLAQLPIPKSHNYSGNNNNNNSSIFVTSNHNSNADCIKIFGVCFQNNVDNHNPMKKSVSMGNPSSEKVENNDSEDDAEDLADGVSQRKRWTEEEHKIFLIGLKKLGRGDWKGISQKFVTTRSPSQVASHAQKYFLRKATIDKKKPRSSVFDVSLNEPVIFLSLSVSSLALSHTFQSCDYNHVLTGTSSKGFFSFTYGEK